MQEYLPDNSVDLIYLDPPFFSRRNFEAIWADGSEIRSFEDSNWYQRICINCENPLTFDALYCPRCGKSTRQFKQVRRQDLSAYLNWIEPRLRGCHRVLRETGSIYVHLDWHAVHYIKTILDDIFGYKNFRNEIIWHYGLGGSSPRCFSRKHDNILFYSKGEDYYFNPPKIPASSRRLRGKLKKLDDVWNIPSINNMAKERLGYPTQKPLKLLQRIIYSSSRVGDLVLDPFAGCSTTLVAAHLLKRRWIGIDISPTSCRVSLQRLIESNARLSIADLIDYPVDEEDLRNLSTQEIVNWVSTKMGLKSIKNNVGLTFKGLPVLIAPKFVDSSEIRRFANSIKQDFTLVSFEFKDDVLEEIKNLENEHHFQISIKKISDLFEA